MIKSLESLEELKDEIIPDYALDYEEQEGYNDWIEELYQTIKQELEHYHNALQEQYDYSTCRCYDELLFRCKHLEKENNELKQDILSFEDYSYDLDCEKEQLEKENQELKDKIQILEQSVKDTYDTSQEIIADLKKENQELKEKNTKMFVELSDTVTVLNKFLEYLDKDKTKLIAKYSLKETLFKIVDEVLGNDKRN